MKKLENLIIRLDSVNTEINDVILHLKNKKFSENQESEFKANANIIEVLERVYWHNRNSIAEIGNNMSVWA